MPNPRFHPVMVLVAVAATAVSAAAQNPSAPSLFRGQTAASAHMIAVSTPVPAAEEHFMLGLRSLDAEQGPVALKHFEEAVKADGSFALAHLYAGITSPSLAGYKSHLDHAVSRAATGSPLEQLMITIEQRAFANDLNGRLEAAKQFVAAAPTEPRAYRALARAHAVLRQMSEERAALIKAIQLSPDFAALHAELANSYTQFEPVNLTEAAAHIRHALTLEPKSAYIHDYQGDFYRATNELEKARASYTRMTELNPDGALGYQQLGHVNAFLGNYKEARADYDKAISLATVTQTPGFQVARALVSVYAGDAAAAEKEIEEYLNKIDGMNHPNPNQAKINALNEQWLIAQHYGHFDVAQRAADRLGTVWQAQVQIANTPTMRGLASATSAYAIGMIAIRRSDFATGRAKAKEYMDARQAEQNPRKNEGAHALLGMADLLEGKPESAIAHLAEIPSDNIYYTYYRAVALEKAGRSAEAKPLFQRVAERNFSTAGVALTRKEAAAHLKK